MDSKSIFTLVYTRSRVGMERRAGDAAPIKSSNYVTAVRFTDSRQSSGVCGHAEHESGRSRRAAFRDGRPTFAP